jgi:NitT/TauT family transport system substrate-binding protein
MKKLIQVLVVALLFGGTLAHAIARDLVVGYSVLSASVAQLWVTQDAGIFDKHGLKVKPIFVQGGTRTTQALLSGDLDIAYVASPGIISAVAGGAQLVFLTGIYRTLPYMIYGAKGIGTPAQLRGKRVGITTFGDLSDFGTRFGLRAIGLDPDKDVSLVQMGGQPVRMAALQSGAMAATILNPPYTFHARKLGLPLLIDLIGKVEFAGTSHAIRRDDLQRRRDEMQRFVDAVVEGNQYFITHKQESVKSMAHYLRTSDLSSLEESYDLYAKRIMSDTPVPSPSAFRAAIEYVARDFPSAAKLRPEDVYDTSLVQSAVARLRR